MFPILYYNNLDYSNLKPQFDKVIKCLKEGDFKSPDVKKLKPTGYLRAKLDAANRVLFIPIRYNDQLHLLILEVIKNHAYDKSRFLRGAKVSEEEITAIPIEPNAETTQLKFIPTNHRVYLLDKFIGFDQIQEEMLQSTLPLIIIGSAGSGKTSVTLEKLKTLEGRILYVTLSSYLTSHAQKLYFAHNYKNDQQEIDFLSFKEFLETIEIPQGKEITKGMFLHWFSSQVRTKYIGDNNKLFEEFIGVINGSVANKPYLTKDDYLKLGVKQSIYQEDQRQEVYSLFEKYLEFLNKENYYDSNILSYYYKDKISPSYDAIVVDEVQDFTNSQLSLVLKSLKNSSQFLLCGDANQIVHPNFFSWSKLKSYFYNDSDLDTHNITRILTKNYRNTPEVIELANRVLRFKNYCFGSIDKESHYLIESTAKVHGTVSCIDAKQETIKKINELTSRSTNYAIIVLYEHDKKKVREFFNTPLIFTVQEAKGLEYDNIILYDFISSEPTYGIISHGIDRSFLNVDFKYARAKDKTDKSLEIYKFYVNALYIAITRSICNVYMLESNTKHIFLKLLNIDEIKEVNITAEQSSKEEWQKVAHDLLMQGKEEQAKAIEENILQYKSIDWVPITIKEFEQLKSKVLENKTDDKRETIKLLNYAILYNNNKLIRELQNAGVRAAKNIAKCELLMQDEYFREYIYKSDSNLLQSIANFGVDYRNLFNLTPLMCAAYIGNTAHLEKLIKLGASIDEVDNNNRNAFMIVLSKAINNDKFCQYKLLEIYDQLRPDSLSLKSNNKLIKIDSYRPEYLFLMIIITIIKNTLEIKESKDFEFKSVLLYVAIQKFPEEIIPAYRKKREYISGLLARNEIDSKYPTGRQLFIRTSRGVYRLNKAMQIKIKDGWHDIMR